MHLRTPTWVVRTQWLESTQHLFLLAGSLSQKPGPGIEPHVGIFNTRLKAHSQRRILGNKTPAMQSPTFLGIYGLNLTLCSGKCQHWAATFSWDILLSSVFQSTSASLSLLPLSCLKVCMFVKFPNNRKHEKVVLTEIKTLQEGWMLWLSQLFHRLYHCYPTRVPVQILAAPIPIHFLSSETEKAAENFSGG